MKPNQAFSNRKPSDYKIKDHIQSQPYIAPKFLETF
jgi:hypothetical protein